MSAGTRLVMLVQADSKDRSQTRGLLEAEGYAVIEMSHGKAALDHLVTHKDEPAVIVLDLGAPEINGWEFLAIIRSYVRLARISVIAISEVAPHKEAMERGIISRHVLKPVDLNVLLETVRACAGTP